MKRQEMVDLVMEVDHDGSGEVEYAEFLEIMTTTLQRLAEESETSNKAEGQVRGWGGGRAQGRCAGLVHAHAHAHALIRTIALATTPLLPHLHLEFNLTTPPHSVVHSVVEAPAAPYRAPEWCIISSSYSPPTRSILRKFPRARTLRT